MHAKLFYVAIFVLGFVLPSLALGKLAVLAPRWLPAPRVARFLAGMFAAPFVLPLAALASGVWPDSPRVAWVALPAALGALALALTPGSLAGLLYRDVARTWRAAGIGPWAGIVTWALALAVLTTVAVVLVNNAAYPIVGQDALKYANHALGFVRTRDLADLPSWTAPLGGNVMGGSHSIAYQLVLALALLATPEPAVGYPDDHALRTVAQVFVVYVGLGTAALAALSRRPGAPALALLALLTAAGLGYFSYAHSRDPYRIAALLLAVLVLVAGRRRAGPRQLALIALGSAFAVLAHTVDLLYLGCIVAVVVVMRARTDARDAAGRALAAGLGTALAGLHYVDNVVRTGSAMGAGAYQAYRDTPLWDALLAQTRWVRAEQMSLVERLVISAIGQGVAISLAGAALALAFLLRWARRPDPGGAGPALGAAVLVAYLPLLGVFDGGAALPLSSFFSTNPRYLTHAQPFTAVLVALGIGLVVARAGRHARIVLPAAALALALVAAPTVRATWSKVNVTALDFLLVAEEIDRATGAGDGVVLVDQDFRRYYLAGKTAFVAGRPAWPALRAETPAEAGRWLAGAGVTHVVFRIERMRGWWARLPLVSYLERAPGVTRSIEPLGSVVYTLPGDRVSD